MIKRISAKLNQFESNPSYQYGFLIAITLLALALRLYKLGEWSFWVDEVATVNRAHGHFNLETIISYWPPPISVILTGGVLHVLGTNEWSARLIPTLVGVISIPILYFPIKRLLGPVVALISGLIIALSTWHLYWSQNARFYTSLLLFYTLALFAFFFGIEKGRFRYIILSLLLLVAAMGERSMALFLVPVWAFYLVSLKIFTFEMSPRFRFKNLAPILLAGVAFGIYETFRFFYAESLVVHAFFKFFDNPDQLPQPPLQLVHSIVTHIGVPLICLGSVGGLYLLWEKKRIGLLLLLGATVPNLILLIASPFGWTADRYAFITLSSWAILSAVAVKELFSQVEGRKKILALGIVLLLVADPLVQDAAYYRGQKGRRPDWHQIYTFIEQRRVEGDLVIATKYKLGLYYLDPEVMPIEDMDPGVIINNGQRTWFVVDAYANWIRPDTVNWIKQNSRLVQVFPVYIDDWSTNVLIYLYEPTKL